MTASGHFGPLSSRRTRRQAIFQRQNAFFWRKRHKLRRAKGRFKPENAPCSSRLQPRLSHASGTRRRGVVAEFGECLFLEKAEDFRMKSVKRSQILTETAIFYRTVRNAISGKNTVCPRISMNFSRWRHWLQPGIRFSLVKKGGGR